MITFLLLPVLFMAGAVSAAIPAAPGWYQIPNTQLDNVCACSHGFSEVCGSTGCSAIVGAWNSGVFDSKRNRLVIWGGGHHDYYGNELYALNLNSLTMTRLNDPGLPIASSCTEAIVNGTQPNSRHTYDGLVYLEKQDKLFSFSGSIACGNSGLSNTTWLFNFGTMAWEKPNPTGTNPRMMEGPAVDYDPVTEKVFVHDAEYLYAYDPSTNSYQQTDYHWMNGGTQGVIDSKRHKFLQLGGGQAWVTDITPGGTYAHQALVTTGGDAIINSNHPGLIYDPLRDRIVAWSGGNTVYSLNMDTKVWAATTYSGGPGAANGQGTYKRWNYSAALDLYVLVNGTNQNAYTFRFPGTANESANKITSALEISVSPNPVRRSASLHLAGASRAGVYDLRGRKAAGLSFTAQGDATLQTGALSNGVYIVKALTGGRELVTRFLIQK